MNRIIYVLILLCFSSTIQADSEPPFGPASKNIASRDDKNQSLFVDSEIKKSLTQETSVSDSVDQYRFVTPDLQILRDNTSHGDVITLDTLDGDKISVAFESYGSPAASPVLYWIGHVIGHEKNSYVRFTIDSKSIFSTDGYQPVRIDGLVRIGDKVTYMRPLNNDVHLLYETRSGKTPGLDFGVTKENVRALKLRAWGQQKDLIENLPKGSYELDRTGSIKSVDAKGSDHLGLGTFRDKRDGQEVIDKLAPYLPLTRRETVKLWEKSETANSILYTYTQYKDDIYIGTKGTVIEVDKATRQVKSVNVDVLDTSEIDFTPKINEDQALEFLYNAAEKEPGNEYKMALTGESPPVISLSYVTLSENVYKLVWLIVIDDAWDYHVDATTGEVLPLFTISFDASSVIVDTCDASQSNHNVTQCGPPQVVTRDGQCSNINDSRCTNSKYTTPHTVIKETGQMIDAILHSDIDELGMRGKINVAVDVLPASPSSTALASTVFRKKDPAANISKDRNVIRFYRNKNGATTPGVIVHEVGHVYTGNRGYVFYNDRRFKGDSVSRGQALSLYEGIADITAVVYRNWKNNGDFKPPYVWKYYPQGRDLSQPKSNFRLSDGEHENGRRIGHMFYRLVTDKTVDNTYIDLKQAFQIFDRAILRLSAEAYKNRPLTQQEFFQALYDSEKDHVIKIAIDAAAQAVGISVDTTVFPNPGASRPTKVDYIGATLTNRCIDNNRSTWSVFWSPSPRTTNYFLWHFEGGYWRNNHVMSHFPAKEIFTRFNTKYRVNACNFHGCSGLSDVEVPVDCLC